MNIKQITEHWVDKQKQSERKCEDLMRDASKAE